MSPPSTPGTHSPRPPLEAALCLAAGVLLLAGAGALSWWRLIAMPEPGYAMAARALCFSLAVGAVVLAGLRRLTPGISLAAGALALTLPSLLVLTVAFLDPASLTEEIYQTNEADRLVKTINRMDVNPQVAWSDLRSLSAHR